MRNFYAIHLRHELSEPPMDLFLTIEGCESSGGVYIKHFLTHMKGDVNESDTYRVTAREHL